ncbi:hypothetical protein MNBD_GAMMA06-236 [hydrothermal vent metagenome]|uniref:Uncharacterized protein n=1 Tax=hydrothermal vent metagenome TaxID=652676 RepID=A0A3B0WML2_9ZZZZ
MKQAIYLLIKLFVKKNNHLKPAALATLLMMLTACGGGGNGDGNGTSESNSVESSPDFIAKAEAVNFSRIRLYKGHINEDEIEQLSREPLAELDTSNLSSGDLITIHVEFEITGEIENYSLGAQLVPESIFSLFNPGDTIGDIVSDKADEQQGEGLIELGGAFIDEIKPGILHGVIFAKLPILTQDSVYKIAVNPVLQFLSSGKEINTSDLEIVPVLIDDRELTISKLDEVSVKIINTPDLTIKNDFTQLEIGGNFDENGYSVDPVFQTSVEVDLTTLGESEEIVLSLSWTNQGGTSFPLGLLSSDAEGNEIISEKARFKIEQTGVTSVVIPVVAYAPIKAKTALLKQATDIKDVADEEVPTAEFGLDVFYVEGGNDVSAGTTYSLFLPLVRQPNQLQVLAAVDVINYTVLRARKINGVCLGFIPDIDTGLLSVGSDFFIKASTCPENPNAGFLWRYDSPTKQLISKIKDTDGDSYCITAIKSFIIGALKDGGNSAFGDVKLRKCAPPTFISFPPTTQQFEFIGDEISGRTIMLSNGSYLDVDEGSQNVSVQINNAQFASNFFTNPGVQIDNDGRVFYVGKFYNNSWGNANLAQASLNYGGESYMDYMPVIGATTQGNATLSASLFGANANLLDTRFILKKYLSKKTSTFGKNYPDVKVGNGAVFKIDVTGFAALQLGNDIEEKTITETFDPLSITGDVFDNLVSIEDLEKDLFDNKLEETFLDKTFTIGVIPVNIKGGIEGNVKVAVELSTPNIGFDLGVKQTLDLSGFLSAEVTIYLATVGLEGKIEAVDQSLDFSANSGFNSTSLTTISFDIGSSLDAELKLLKGKVTAFLEYPKFCWCKKGVKKVKKEKVLYSSPYLFQDKWQVYSASKSAIVIDF